MKRAQRETIRASDKAACTLAEKYGVSEETICKIRARKKSVMVGAALRRAIKEACGSREDLAAKFNVSISTVRNIKNGAGGRVVGSNNGRAKLTTHDVAAIKQSEERGVDLAAQYGVSRSTISNIRAGRKWGWV